MSRSLGAPIPLLVAAVRLHGWQWKERRGGGTLGAVAAGATLASGCRRRAAHAAAAAVVAAIAAGTGTGNRRVVAPSPHPPDIVLVGPADQPGQMTGRSAELEGPGGQLEGKAVHFLILTIVGCIG